MRRQHTQPYPQDRRPQYRDEGGRGGPRGDDSRREQAPRRNWSQEDEDERTFGGYWQDNDAIRDGEFGHPGGGRDRGPEAGRGEEGNDYLGREYGAGQRPGSQGGGRDVAGRRDSVRGEPPRHRGNWRGSEPVGRRGYQDENGSYGGAEYDRDPFGREQGSWGSGGQELDESSFDQSYALRRGFGRGMAEMSQQGHWGSDQGDLRSTLGSPTSRGYGLGAGGREWSDVARNRQGPRGYTRSDERIREFICERLAQHHQLEVSDVSVEVRDGTVVLEGTVPERYMKHAIEDTADNCWGVKDVENHIRVAPQGMQGQQSTVQQGFRGMSSQGYQGVHSGGAGAENPDYEAGRAAQGTHAQGNQGRGEHGFQGAVGGSTGPEATAEAQGARNRESGESGVATREGVQQGSTSGADAGGSTSAPGSVGSPAMQITEARQEEQGTQGRRASAADPQAVSSTSGRGHNNG